MREFTTPFIGPGYRADTQWLARTHRLYRQPSRRAGRSCWPCAVADGARPRQTVTLSDLIACVMTKEIDPIKDDQTDDRDSRDIFLGASPANDSQSHVPANDHDQGVKIKVTTPHNATNASGFHLKAARKSPCRNAIVERVAPQVMQGKPVTARNGHLGHGKPKANQTPPPTIDAREMMSQISS